MICNKLHSRVLKVQHNNDQEKLHPVCKSQLSRMALESSLEANYRSSSIAQHQELSWNMMVLIFRLPATNCTHGNTGLARRVAASVTTSASSTLEPPATWPPPSSSSSWSWQPGDGDGDDLDNQGVHIARRRSWTNRSQLWQTPFHSLWTQRVRQKM